MHFLSLETSTNNFSLAVSKDEDVLRFRNVPTTKLLENSIIPTIDKLLDSAKVPFKKLDAFAIGLGPGSFTSLRVGLSTLKAFAMGTTKPVVGICSLDVIAEGVRHQPCDQICVITDARRSMLYSALYDKTSSGWKRNGEYQLTPVDQVLDHVKGKTLFVGDGVTIYRKVIEAAYKENRSKNKTECKAIFADEEFYAPQAKHLAKLAFERLAAKDYDDSGLLQPIYLYAQHCQVDPSNKGAKQ